MTFSTAWWLVFAKAAGLSAMLMSISLSYVLYGVFRVRRSILFWPLMAGIWGGVLVYAVSSVAYVLCRKMIHP